MKIQINPKQKIIIVLDDKEYTLSKPNLGTVDAFEGKVHAAKAKGLGGTRVVMDYVTECGLPKDVVENLDSDQLEAIVNALTPVKKK